MADRRRGWASSGVHRIVGVAFDDQARRHQLGDEARDRRAAEAGDAGEIGATRKTALAERVDDALPVAVTEPFE